MNAEPGTYALLLKSTVNKSIQIGRWREIELQHGYYTYIGSAFGSGGVRARVLRHLGHEKKNHWHIDYLRQHCDPLGAWYTHDPERLEHEWAQALNQSKDFVALKGFGCSDCESHLFYAPSQDEVEVFLKNLCSEAYWYEA